ncbi:MAG TPA: 50S ribosomal protein L13 [Firmicutes bacterium]|nr:50S ribosomal protein L13 [Bacillota bacterium]
MANKENIERKWYVIDATDKTLGRLATQIATILRGKHKPIYTPHVDTGDHVIVINAEKVRLTGNKLQDKKYYRHSGYPGGLRVRTAGQILSSGRPEQVLKLAVKGMLPHNRLGRKMFKKLKVYAGNEHPHSAQKPEKLDI